MNFVKMYTIPPGGFFRFPGSPVRWRLDKRMDHCLVRCRPAFASKDSEHFVTFHQDDDVLVDEF